MLRETVLLYIILLSLDYSESNLVGKDQGECKCIRIYKDTSRKDQSFECIHFSESDLHKMALPDKCDVPNLKKVDFSKNRMGNVSRTKIFSSLNKTMMAKITELDLTEDAITDVDRDTFQQFKALKKIVVRENSISPASLMSAFGYLTNSTIETLCLKTNNIGNIIDGTFGELHNLKKLDLSNNKLLAIPRFMEGNKCILTSLTVLHLSDNAITSLDNFVGDSKCLGKLKTLYLGGNKIHTVDPMLSIILKLHNLDISNFPLANWSEQMIGDLLKSQTELKTLIMNECGIEELPENTFTSMMNLTKLRLANNRISSWTATTFGKDMHALDLQGNRIRLINQSTFPDTTKELDFSRNPFTCDCRLQWFRNWIKANHGRLNNHPDLYKCESPQSWKNKGLMTFNPTFVDCNPWNPYVIVAMVICITLVLLVLLATIVQNYKDKFRSLLNQKRQYERVPDSIDRAETT